MTDDDRQDDDMNSGLTVAEYSLLQCQLAALPDTMPPRGVWQRIEAQAQAEGLVNKPPLHERFRWVAGAAVAAGVAMLALNLTTLNAPPVNDVDNGAVDGGGPHTVPGGTDETMLPPLAALKIESRDLEQNLRLLPANPAVMKVSTATAIHDLEQRIAAIDYLLNDRTIALEAEQEELYWQERVRLMKLLVQLRYAQAQRTAF